MPLAGEARAESDQQITLITGDRVTLSGGKVGQVSVEPGPRRRGIRFTTQKTKDHLYVLPSDIGKQLTSGRLDLQLFDVTELIRSGYGDKSSTTIPVIVTYSGTAQRRAPPLREPRWPVCCPS
jgi:hypothetical protein